MNEHHSRFGRRGVSTRPSKRTEKHFWQPEGDVFTISIAAQPTRSGPPNVPIIYVMYNCAQRQNSLLVRLFWRSSSHSHVDDIVDELNKKPCMSKPQPRYADVGCTGHSAATSPSIKPRVWYPLLASDPSAVFFTLPLQPALRPPDSRPRAATSRPTARVCP